MCEILIFCTPQSQAQLESGCNLVLRIMFTIILDSLENNRLRKEKSLGRKVLLVHGCIFAL